MTVYTAITTLDDQEKAYALAQACENIRPEPTGIACLEIEDGSGQHEVAVYFDEKPDDLALKLLSLAYQARDFCVSKLDHRDWVAQVQRELKPVVAGRFIIYGRHDRAQCFISDKGIEIEAAMAFGTGHHATTQGCLLLTEHLTRTPFYPLKIADIGTGTGVLAIGAQKSWPKAHVFASDIEEIAVQTARCNFKANKAARIRTLQAVGLDHPLYRQEAPFDLVYANILARPLKDLALEFYKATRSGGYVILSGILKTQGAGVLAIYSSAGFKLQRRQEIGEWTSFLLRRS